MIEKKPLVMDLYTADPSAHVFNGKIYIYLGDAYSATAVELRMNHPVYYYTDGGIRLWSGVNAASKSYVDSAISSIDLSGYAEKFIVSLTNFIHIISLKNYQIIPDALWA